MLPQGFWTPGAAMGHPLIKRLAITPPDVRVEK